MKMGNFVRWKSPVVGLLSFNCIDKHCKEIVMYIRLDTLRYLVTSHFHFNTGKSGKLKLHMYLQAHQ